MLNRIIAVLLGVERGDLVGGAGCGDIGGKKPGNATNAMRQTTPKTGSGPQADQLGLDVGGLR